MLLVQTMKRWWAIGLLSTLLCVDPTSAAEQLERFPVDPPRLAPMVNGTPRLRVPRFPADFQNAKPLSARPFNDSKIVLAQAETADQPPVVPQPSATPQPTDSEPEATQPPAPESAATDSVFSGIGFGWLNNTVVSGFETYLNVASGAFDAAFIESQTDAGSVLELLPGITIEKRSPINSDPVQQGRRLGQITARGSYWFPARQDLDTMLSKIDSRLVGEIISIKGPYSVMYGPGLSFLDLRLLDSPRYDGYQNYGSTSLDYNTNGQQWHGRQEYHGGSWDWGYRVGYSHRTGSDYETGDGTELPSSYDSRLPDITLGGDLTDDSSIDVRYLRLDQTDVEYPGQFFDINYLVTDAYEVSYVLENQCRFDRLTIDAWYNRTRFEGDNLRPGKRRQTPSLDTFAVFPDLAGGIVTGRLVSNTDVDAMSSGFRIAASWDMSDQSELTAGVDLRYIKQELNEFNQIIGIPAQIVGIFNLPPVFTRFTNTPIPDSHSSNPGLFAEYVGHVTDRLRIKSGARVDWVSANAARFVNGTDFFLDPLTLAPVSDLHQILGSDFDRDYDLWAAFLTAEYELHCHWTMNWGGGHAERPPTMTQLFAANPFVAALPQFAYTSTVGDPSLEPERVWQVDMGLTAEYQHIRGSLLGFYAWIDDYITLDFVDPPTGIGFAYVNTDHATLSGFELSGEVDLTCRLTAFGNLSFVEGRDHTRNGSVSTNRARFQPGTPRSGSTLEEEPLPAIQPFDSIAGLRFGPPSPQAPWSVEFFARIVDNQDRIATTLRELATPGFTTYNVRSYWQVSDDLIVSAGVSNLTDKNYQEHFDTHIFSTVFQPGISFYFGSQLTY